MIAAIWGEVLNSSFQYTEPAQPRIVPQNAAEWALALLSTALVPALAEEMCFRGMLQGLLTRRLPRAGIWITALVFAAGHLPTTVSLFGRLDALIIARCFLLNGAFGYFFGYCYIRYGIQYAMVAHMGIHFVSKVLLMIFF